MEGLGIACVNAKCFEGLDQSFDVIGFIVMEDGLDPQGLRYNKIAFVVVNEYGFLRAYAYVTQRVGEDFGALLVEPNFC